MIRNSSKRFREPIDAPFSEAPLSRRALIAGTAATMIAANRRTAYGDENPPEAATPRNAFTSLDTYLGATKRIVDELRSHEHDDYYLSTPFGNTGPNGAGGPIDSWDSWHPNGKPDEKGRSYMNCAGFLVAVFEACGADCDTIGSYVGSGGYNRGNKANLSRWKCFLDDHASMKNEYDSKEAMLASGLLQKGDLIIAEPNDWSSPGADCHVMFFWGDTPTQDKAWHSTGHAQGVIDGCVPGNAISNITAKHSDCYWIHVPLEHSIDVDMKKTSEQAHVSNTEANNAYSFEGATFSVYESYENGGLSGFITSFTTDAEGAASVTLPSRTHVWIKEDTPPLGFAAWDEPRRFDIRNEGETIVLEDSPCLVKLTVIKTDEETGNAPQGHAQLEGAWYELIDANGRSHKEQTRWNDRRNAWTAVFENLPRGKAKIREALAPTGYLLDRENEWFELDLSPDSHEILFETTPFEHKERVIRGDISGAKFGEELEGGEVKNPLAGCEFSFWLQDDGSLRAKGYDVRSIVDADGNPLLGPDGTTLTGALMGSTVSRDDGRFTSKDLAGANGGRGTLPYGVYTLVETKCPDSSFALIEPVRNIALTEEGQEVFLIIEDRLIASPVRVKKVDAESGRPIATPGTKIQLLRKNDRNAYEVVEFKMHYPEDRIVSSFVLPESGIVQFPERLPQGSYAIRELEAVPPYTLRQEPVHFEVDESHDWESSEIITVELPNKAAEGVIEAVKTDAENAAPIPGARYEIRAKEDVITPDGVTHHKAGEIIAAPETDENGRWSVGGLSLGKGNAAYIVKETACPDGYVLETSEHDVILSYENDSAAIVTTAIEIKEEPCRLVVEKKDSCTNSPIEGVLLELKRRLDDGSEKVVESAKTNAEGKAEFARMARDTTYLVEEVMPRTDLGYPSQKTAGSLYLSPEGVWHSSSSTAKQEGEKGARIGLITLENEPTRVVVIKVDSRIYDQAQEVQADGDENRGVEAHLQNAMLEGGEFELLDSEGNAVMRQDETGVSRWSSSKRNAQTFTHLVPGATYEIAEHRAPDGYKRLEARHEFIVEDTTEAQYVILKNERMPQEDALFAKTSDPLAPISIATGALAAGSAALLWYSKRRNDIENGL